MAQAHENISHFHNTMYRRQKDCRYAGYPSLESKLNLFIYVHIVEDHVKEVITEEQYKISYACVLMDLRKQK